MKINRLIMTALIAGMVAMVPFGLSAQSRNPVTVNPDVVDALGELIRDMNTIKGAKKELPKEDDSHTNLRNKFDIPSRVSVVAPRGGEEVAVFVFNSEDLCVVRGDYEEISPSEYKYLQSLHNLKTVYSLFDREPVTLGSTVYAFERSGSGDTVVFFNNKGSLHSVRVSKGNSLCLKGSPYIIRPTVVR